MSCLDWCLDNFARHLPHCTEVSYQSDAAGHSLPIRAEYAVGRRPHGRLSANVAARARRFSIMKRSGLPPNYRLTTFEKVTPPDTNSGVLSTGGVSCELAQGECRDKNPNVDNTLRQKFGVRGR